MSSAGKIVKHLIAKNGPMSTQSFYPLVPTYVTQLVSKTHLKKKILVGLEEEGAIYKQVYRETPTSKPVWKWQFRDESLIEKYKNL